MHSARTLPHLSTLVENLHGYLDTVLSGVIRYCLNREAVPTVGASLQALRMHELGFLDGFDKTDIGVGNYKHVIFGRNNPLSPCGASFI